MIQIAVALISFLGTLGAALIVSYAQIRSARIQSDNLTVSTSTKPKISLILSMAALAIFVGATVFALVSSLSDRTFEPTNTPNGFKPVSWESGQVGIAIPQTWWEDKQPPLLTVQGPNKLDSINVAVFRLKEENKLAKIEADIENQFKELGEGVGKLFRGLNKSFGEIEASPHHGYPAYKTTFKLLLPDGEERENIWKIIFDYSKNRFILVNYPNNLTGQKIISSLNLK